MIQEEVIKVLEKTGAVLRGHFVGTNWQHLDTYIDKDCLGTNPIALSMLAASIAIEARQYKIQTVVSPAIGAIQLGTQVAYHLSVMIGNVVPFIMAVSEGDSFRFRPQKDDLIKDRLVLVVVDVLNTGFSTGRVVDCVRNLGGSIVAVATIWNRGGIEPCFFANSSPFFPKVISLVDIKLNSWDSAVCPLCRGGLPINTDIGHGRGFLAIKGLK